MMTGEMLLLMIRGFFEGRKRHKFDPAKDFTGYANGQGFFGSPITGDLGYRKPAPQLVTPVGQTIKDAPKVPGITPPSPVKVEVPKQSFTLPGNTSKKTLTPIR